MLTYGSTKVAGFDWVVEFAEVFANGGFDVVVANPPYVRQELIKHLKPTLQKVYPAVYTGTADLYCYFYTRALELLRPNGMLTFISPNKWFRANYGKKLRKHIAETCQVHSITDFGDLPVFKSATAYPMIFIAQNEKIATNSTILTQVKSLETPYPNVLAVIRERGQKLPHTAISGSNWTLTDTTSANRLKKMEATGVSLNEYVKGKIYWGVVTGFNKAFIIDGVKRAELIAQDPKSVKIIKPLAVGKDIRKWRIMYQDKWLILTKRGIDINAYPAIKAHLTRWQVQLTPKKTGKELQGRARGDYKWYELQASPGDTERFEKAKIIYPVISKDPRFTLDTQGTFTNDKTFVIPSADLYPLAILNSTSVWEYLNSICSKLRGGDLELRGVYMNKLPIPNASTTEREAISKLVQKCLNAIGIGCEAWEREIDDRVAALYGL